MEGHLYKKEKPEGWWVAYSIEGWVTRSEIKLQPGEHISQDILDEVINTGYAEVAFEREWSIDHECYYATLYPKVQDEKNDEYILCAAIWYKDIPIKKEIPVNVRPVNCDRGLVFCGHRHCHCMYTMVSVTGLRSVETEVGEYVQGFLTSKNRFVDREEGARIHRNNGHSTDFENRLFSEDLY